MSVQIVQPQIPQGIDAAQTHHLQLRSHTWLPAVKCTVFVTKAIPWCISAAETCRLHIRGLIPENLCMKMHRVRHTGNTMMPWCVGAWNSSFTHLWSHTCRVGQDRIYTPYMTVYLVISLPKMPQIYRMHLALAYPTNLWPLSDNIWSINWLQKYRV
jgi:hypothetical protein